MDLHPGPEKRRAAQVKLAELEPIRRALHENEDWYQDLIEHSQDLLCIHDLEGRLLSVNPAPARVLGYSVEEILQIPMQDLIAPEFRQQFDAYLNQIASVGESRGLLAVMTRSGERRIWEYHNTLRTEGVASPIVRGIAHDVTEQKRAEKLAREASEAMSKDIAERKQVEERLREYERVVEGLEEVIAVLDRDYRYVIANRALLKYRRMEKEQIIGHSIREVVGNEVFETFIKPRLDECLQGKAVQFEFEHNYPELGERYLLISYFPIEGPTGVDRIAAIVRDDTERKRAEEALRQNVAQLQQVTEELRLAKEKLSEEKLYLEEAIDTELGFGEIIGHSSALRDVMAKVAKVAPSDATVLLLGETGTGKELVARALHRKSHREGNSFIKLNCAAIPSGLVESELFGHEKGAFTGAVARKLGRLELADRGTLFLDEIGEIPLSLQPKLLRVLQDMEFERLGGTQTLKVNFRLLAATNRDLLQSVKAREFRSDLYYRLNVFPIHMPPLRERREDVRPLIEYFVRKFANQMKKSITSIPSRTMEMLVRWDWPGNIRELENFVERSVILTPGSVLQAPLSELQAAVAGRNDGSSDNLRDKERERILRALRECHGKLGGPDGAAARLGLKRTTLQSRLDQLGIKPGAYRG
jgi:PAS domain S-box-containing protein